MKSAPIETTALKPWNVRPEDFSGLAKLNRVNVGTNEKGEIIKIAQGCEHCLGSGHEWEPGPTGEPISLGPCPHCA